MYRIEDSEIDWVSKHPLNHGRAYVREVREKAFKRYCRVKRSERPRFKEAMNRQDKALVNWPWKLIDGEIVLHAPHLIRDQESGYMARVERLAESRSHAAPTH